MVNGEVWPISHTNEFGASCDDTPLERVADLLHVVRRHQRPVGVRSRTIVPEPPVVRSVTVMCQPSCAAVMKVDVIVSPACMTSGRCFEPFVSIALKAAGSWKTGFWPVGVELQTGEQTVYVSGAWLDHEAAVRRAVADDRVGIELQLHEGLAEQAVRVVDRAAEPERRPGRVDREAAVARQHERPGQSCAEPGALETGSSSGSSWPEQPPCSAPRTVLDVVRVVRQTVPTDRRRASRERHSSSDQRHQ